MLVTLLFPNMLFCQQSTHQSFEDLRAIKKTYPDSVINFIKNCREFPSDDVNTDDWKMLLGEAYYYGDQHDKAYAIFDSLHQYGKPSFYQDRHLYQALTNTSLFLGKFDKAQKFALRSLQLAKEQNDSLGIFKALIAVGNSQYYSGSAHVAIKKYMQALSVAPDLTMAGYIYVNLGSLLIEAGQYKEGIEYIKKGSQAICDEAAKRDKMVVLNNLAVGYYHLERIDSSRFYLDQYAAFKEKPTYNHFFIDHLSGNISIKQKEYAKAQQFLDSALSLSQSLNDKHSEALVMGSLSWLYNQTGRKKEANRAYDLSKTMLDSLGSTLDLIELEELRLTSNLAPHDLNHFKSYRKISSENSFGEIDQIISSFNKEIELQANQDSLEQALMIQQIHSVENSRYRYGLLLCIAIISLLASLLYIYRTRSKQLKSTNQKLEEERQDLIFQNEDLESINQYLKKQHAQAEPIPVDSFIDIVVNNKQIKLNTKNITYILAEDNGCRFYLGNRSEWSYVRLKDILQQLPHQLFVQIQRSNVVKIEDIESVNHSSLKMSDGTELKIGRSYKQEVLNLFKQK